MSLTPDNLNVLKRPFARADYEFVRGFVYLTEEAITTRIEEVDPSWEFAVLQIDRTTTQVIAHARMTINGVFRDGIGMQQVNEKAGEAEKGAATDALKRCARLFGVGRHLLDAPKEDEFNAWLAAKQKEYSLKPAAAVPNGSSASTVRMATGHQEHTDASNNVVTAERDPLSWVDEAAPGVKVTVLPTLDMKALYNRAMKAKIGVKNWAHFENLYELLASEKVITLASTEDQVFEAMKAHEAQKEAVS